MKLKDGLVWREIEGEVFIVDVKQERICQLNETSTLIFKALLKGKKKEEIVNEIVENYIVNRDVVEKDFDEVIKEFVSKGIFYEEEKQKKIFKTGD